MKLCYIDGKFVSPEAAVLPVSDLIIQRGIGLFETISTHKRRPLMLTPHLERLLTGAKNSYIHPPLGISEMRGIIREGIGKMEGELLIKVYLTGGDVFDRVQGFTNPRFFVTYEPLELPPSEFYEVGIRLEPVDGGRDDPATKTVDYRKAYTLSPHDEHTEILYCPSGEITESAHSSFFLYLNNVLVTAPLSRVLKGTTRQAVIDLAHLTGMEVEERCPLLAELPQASEAFITGSVKKILPVVRVGAQLIGDGRPGSATKHLSELYLEHIEEWLE
ncbi:MAG: aminotransferase class IV [Synergistaceae bacterium]|jgi:branched-chain amino acid aminotransferase|nr:aminotransferase class IV [Synergistaceae bacterium]